MCVNQTRLAPTTHHRPPRAQPYSNVGKIRLVKIWYFCRMQHAHPLTAVLLQRSYKWWWNGIDFLFRFKRKYRCRLRNIKIREFIARVILLLLHMLYARPRRYFRITRVYIYIMTKYPLSVGRFYNISTTICGVRPKYNHFTSTPHIIQYILYAAKFDFSLNAFALTFTFIIT